MRNLVNSKSLCQQIDAIIEKKKMLSHPFYKVWTEGKLSREALRGYAKQYYQFVYHFPTFISAIHSNAPTLSDRQKLLSNLMDEELGEKNHPQLWLQFCQALNISKEEATSTQPLPQTEELNRTFRTLCQKRSFAEGVAALYAYESQIPAVSEEKIETLNKFYNISGETEVEFFSVHQEADIEHSRISREMLGAIDDGSQRRKAKASARKLRDSLWKFLDGIYENFVEKEEGVPACS